MSILSKNELISKLSEIIVNKQEQEQFQTQILSDLKLDVSKFYKDKEGLTNLFKELFVSLHNFISYNDSGVQMTRYIRGETDLVSLLAYLKQDGKPFFSKGYDILLTFISRNMKALIAHGCEVSPATLDAISQLKEVCNTEIVVMKDYININGEANTYTNNHQEIRDPNLSRLYSQLEGSLQTNDKDQALQQVNSVKNQIKHFEGMFEKKLNDQLDDQENLIQEFKSKEARLRTVEGDLADQKQVLDQQQDRLNQKEEELSQLELKLNQNQNLENEQILDKLKAKIEYINHKEKELEQRLSNDPKYQNYDSKFNELAKENNELKKTLNNLQDQNEAYLNEIDSLRDANRELQDEIRSKSAVRNEDLEEQFEVLREKEEKIKEMMEVVNNTISQKQQALEDYEIQLQQREDDLESKEQEYESLKSEEVMKKSVELERNFHHKQEELNKAKENISQLETRFDKLNSTVQRVETVLGQLKGHELLSVVQKTEIECVHKLIESVKTHDFEKFQDYKGQSSEDYDTELRNKLSDLEQSMKQKEQALQTREGEINKYLQDIKSAFDIGDEKDLSSIHSSLVKFKNSEKVFNEYEGIIDRQESEINTLRSKIKKLLKETEGFDHLKNAKSKLEADLESLKEKNNFFATQLEEKQAALKEFLEQNMEQFNTLKRMEESQPSKMKSLQKKEEVIKDSMTQFQRLKDHSLQELEAREADIAQREEHLTNLQKQISNKYQSLEELSDRADSMPVDKNDLLMDKHKQLKEKEDYLINRELELKMQKIQIEEMKKNFKSTYHKFYDQPQSAMRTPRTTQNSNQRSPLQSKDRNLNNSNSQNILIERNKSPTPTPSSVTLKMTKAQENMSKNDIVESSLMKPIKSHINRKSEVRESQNERINKALKKDTEVELTFKPEINQVSRDINSSKIKEQSQPDQNQDFIKEFLEQNKSLMKSQRDQTTYNPNPNKAKSNSRDHDVSNMDDIEQFMHKQDQKNEFINEISQHYDHTDNEQAKVPKVSHRNVLSPTQIQRNNDRSIDRSHGSISPKLDSRVLSTSRTNNNENIKYVNPMEKINEKLDKFEKYKESNIHPDLIPKDSKRPCSPEMGRKEWMPTRPSEERPFMTATVMSAEKRKQRNKNLSTSNLLLNNKEERSKSPVDQSVQLKDKSPRQTSNEAAINRLAQPKYKKEPVKNQVYSKNLLNKIDQGKKSSNSRSKSPIDKQNNVSKSHDNSDVRVEIYQKEKPQNEFQEDSNMNSKFDNQNQMDFVEKKKTQSIENIHEDQHNDQPEIKSSKNSFKKSSSNVSNGSIIQDLRKNESSKDLTNIKSGEMNAKDTSFKNDNNRYTFDNYNTNEHERFSMDFAKKVELKKEEKENLPTEPIQEQGSENEKESTHSKLTSKDTNNKNFSFNSDNRTSKSCESTLKQNTAVLNIPDLNEETFAKDSDFIKAPQGYSIVSNQKLKEKDENTKEKSPVRDLVSKLRNKAKYEDSNKLDLAKHIDMANPLTSPVKRESKELRDLASNHNSEVKPHLSNSPDRIDRSKNSQLLEAVENKSIVSNREQREDLPPQLESKDVPDQLEVTQHTDASLDDLIGEESEDDMDEFLNQHTKKIADFQKSMEDISKSKAKLIEGIHKSVELKQSNEL